MLALQDYRAVIALLEDRHFGRAARRLGVTQSALSVRLRRIEESLGARLFERSRSGVAPTAAGLAFADGARRVLDAASDAAGAAVSASAGYGETMRVGMTQTAGYQVVGAAIRAFRLAQPLARVRLIEGTTASLEAHLEEREVDAAFLHPPLHGSSLSERRLVTCTLFRVDVAGGQNGPLVRFPRAEAPVLMGRLSRDDDARGVAGQAEANTMLGAALLSEAGYGDCVVPIDFPHPGVQRARSIGAGADQGSLATSVAWRSLDRRPIVKSLVESAVSAAGSYSSGLSVVDASSE